MSDETQKDTSPQPGDPAQPGATDAGGTSETPAADNVIDLDAERLSAEISELKDKLLRAMAETENVRRRSEREKTDSIQYGLTRFARDLLTVADTLEHAIAHLDTSARESASDAVKNVLTGVELTSKELLRVFEKNGIKTVSPKGAKFDPNLHQAIAQVPSPDTPEGHVLEVAQIGYTIGDRLLRPAMVVVSSGGGQAPSGDGPGHSVDTKA